MKMRFTLSFLFTIISMAIYSQNEFKIGYTGSLGFGGAMDFERMDYGFGSNYETAVPGRVYTFGFAYLFKSQYKTNFEINLLYQYQTINRAGNGETDTSEKIHSTDQLQSNKLMLPIKLNRPCRLFKKKMTFYQGLVTAYNFYSIYKESSVRKHFSGEVIRVDKKYYFQGIDGTGWDHKFDLYANIGLNFWSKGSWQVGVDYLLPLTKNSFDANWESNVPRLKENRFAQSTASIRVVYWAK